MAKEKLCITCHQVNKPKKMSRGSIWIEIILWGTSIITAFSGVGFIIGPFALGYSIWRLVTRYTACPECEGREMIPAGSPRAQQILGAHDPDE